MSRHDGSFWYSLGRAVATAASVLPGSYPPRAPRPHPADRSASRENPSPRDPALGLVAGGAVALVAALLTATVKHRRASALGVARGAVAGAGAAAVVLVAWELIAGPREERATEVPDVLDELLNGAGRGIVYAAVVDPFLPGGPVLKGVLAGTLDSLAAPIGGLFARLQPLSPVHRIPVVSALLTIDASETDPFLKHLCNGVLLGLLYGDSGG